MNGVIVVVVVVLVALTVGFWIKHNPHLDDPPRRDWRGDHD